MSITPFVKWAGGDYYFNTLPLEDLGLEFSED